MQGGSWWAGRAEQTAGCDWLAAGCGGPGRRCGSCCSAAGREVASAAVRDVRAHSGQEAELWAHSACCHRHWRTEEEKRHKAVVKPHWGRDEYDQIIFRWYSCFYQVADGLTHTCSYKGTCRPEASGRETALSTDCAPASLCWQAVRDISLQTHTQYFIIMLSFCLQRDKTGCYTCQCLQIV